MGGLQKTLVKYWLRQTQKEIEQPTLQKLHQQYNSLFQKIPLNRVKEKNKVGYVSAIALKLSIIFNTSPSIIAEEIQSLFNELVTHISINNHPSMDGILGNFIAHPSSSGWVYLELSSPGLALWLEWLTQQPVVLPPCSLPAQDRDRAKPVLSDSTVLFAAQYTHARCCALLRLANLAELITVSPVPEGYLRPDAFEIVRATPWLTSEAILRCQHPAEQQLIAQLVTSLDDLSTISPTDWMRRGMKLAHQVSEEFQNFYAACRLWGEVRATDAELVQARLKLVLITQSVLRLLLHDVLGAEAPTEL